MLHFELLHSKQSMLNYDQSKTKNDTEIEKCDSHAWAKGKWKPSFFSQEFFMKNITK